MRNAELTLARNVGLRKTFTLKSRRLFLIPHSAFRIPHYSKKIGSFFTSVTPSSFSP